MSDQFVIQNQTLKTFERQIDYILVDGSGSMIPRWWDSLDAIDAYLNGIRGKVDSHVIVSVFDTNDIDLVQRDAPLADCPTMREQPIGLHQGRTPLYDAINVMGRRLRDMNPQRCSILIVTDGDENASQVTNDVQAKAILDWARAKGWQVTLLGCDFNNGAMARKLGSHEAASLGTSAARLKDATAALADKRHKYGLSGAPMHYTDEERERFGGYLADYTGGN